MEEVRPQVLVDPDSSLLPSTQATSFTPNSARHPSAPPQSPHYFDNRGSLLKPHRGSPTPEAARTTRETTPSHPSYQLAPVQPSPGPSAFLQPAAFNSSHNGTPRVDLSYGGQQSQLSPRGPGHQMSPLGHFQDTQFGPWTDGGASAPFDLTPAHFPFTQAISYAPHATRHPSVPSQTPQYIDNRGNLFSPRQGSPTPGGAGFMGNTTPSQPFYQPAPIQSSPGPSQATRAGLTSHKSTLFRRHPRPFTNEAQQGGPSSSPQQPPSRLVGPQPSSSGQHPGRPLNGNTPSSSRPLAAPTMNPHTGNRRKPSQQKECAIKDAAKRRSQAPPKKR